MPSPNHQVEMDRRIRCASSVPSALRAPAATHLGSYVASTYQ